MIDFCVVFTALLIIWPFLLVITVWLRAFFLQERPGRDEKIFKVIKFKSMTDERDADGNLQPNDKRLTKVGAFIRKTSTDKLPRLINVLKKGYKINHDYMIKPTQFFFGGGIQSNHNRTMTRCVLATNGSVTSAYRVQKNGSIERKGMHFLTN